MTALLKEVLETLLAAGVPDRWKVYDDVATSGMFKEGYLVIHNANRYAACITDVMNHKRALSPGLKGPLAIEKYYNTEWTAVCDADTPKQVVDAFLTYATFGEFNG